MRIALNQRQCYLLVPTKKDFFELPPIGVPLDFERHVQPMIADLMTLLATARLAPDQDWDEFLTTFSKRGRARVTVRSAIEGGAAEFEGRFVALGKG